MICCVDMKTSSSAPQLGSESADNKPHAAVTERQTSKDDSSLATESPSKAAGGLEEECQAEFTPVIPLPKLVEVRVTSNASLSL